MVSERIFRFLCLFCLSTVALGLWKEGPLPGNNVYFNTPIRVLIRRNPSAIQLRAVRGSLTLRHSSGELISISPSSVTLDPNLKTLAAKDIHIHSTDNAGIVFNGNTYRGTFFIHFRNSKVYVINKVELEDYLSGSVGAEMSGLWPLEALKSQVVAARTYALYQIKHPKHSLYDIDATILDQVYRGVEVEHPNIQRALKETHGQFLSYRGKPIRAYFHARCGGMTESAKGVWQGRGRGYAKNVACPYCLKNPDSWTLSLSMDEFAQHLSLEKRPSDPVRIVSVLRSPSGRVHSLQIQSSEATAQLSGDELRALVGYDKLKSSHFDWAFTNNAVQFKGKGLGHGVGMCQWGAKFFAKKGWNYHRILEHYYPELQLSLTSPSKKSP